MSDELRMREPARVVLFLAYYFPPLGGGGVQRSLAFARYLPALGYRPLVVTGPAVEEVQWGPRDETLAERLPEGSKVLRVPGPEAARSGGWRGRAERWLRVEEPFSRWWIDGAASAAREVSGSADVVYASMSPFASGRAAGRIAAEAGKPWVADLRDPWALDDWLVYPTALHRRLELRAMRRTLSTASAIVMNTPESREQLLFHAPELGDRPVVAIPNGFDAAEFDAPEPPRDSGAFRIVHAGHVHTTEDGRLTRVARRTLGGAASGLDTRTRSHLYLVEAVEFLLRRRPTLREKVRVELAGPLSEADAAGLPDYVVSRGYLSHAETIALLRSGDLLFMPMHDLAPGLRARIIPGKTYEYLAAGVPILGAVPEGDARELLESAGNAHVCAPSDAAAMSLVIEGRIDAWLAGRSPSPPDPLVVKRFERRRLTEDLAAVFDSVLGGPAGRQAPEGVAGRSEETLEAAS